MEVYQTEPTDAQLAHLVDPESRSLSLGLLKIDDSPEALVARPGRIPLWYMLLCSAPPVGVAAWYWIDKALHQGLEPLDFIGIVIACHAVPGGIAFVHVLNRFLCARGDFFLLDKLQRTLTLPRLGLRFSANQIHGFFQLHAWAHLGGAGHSYIWTCELSVLVRTADGSIARYPVVVGDYARSISRLAEALADFFQVERRILKLSRRVRKQLQAQQSDR